MFSTRLFLRLWLFFGVFATSLACSDALTIPPPCGDSLTVPLSDELLAQLGASAPVAPACRPAATGEVLINEVVTKPAGKDLDGDGKSNGRDELIEFVSLANELVHLQGAQLVYGGKVRGLISKSPCMAPYTATLLVGSTTGAIQLPKAVQQARLDKTLRLTDSGGVLALVGVAGLPLDQVAVPLASNATEGTIARQTDGARDAPMLAHATLLHANGAQWSPGTCSDGESFPECVIEGVVDRESALRDPRVP